MDRINRNDKWNRHTVFQCEICGIDLFWNNGIHILDCIYSLMMDLGIIKDRR